MKIAVRVDASSKIGTGHFMRCLTLADALKQRGAQIRFSSRHLPEHLRGILVAKGHEFALLDTAKNDATVDELAHAHWLGVSQAQDASNSIRVLSDVDWDWLIVDHYALDARWENTLRGTVKKIMVIDDIADRRHDCDVLLDQNFYADMQTRYTGKVPYHCQLLLGPRYALLRDEFRKLHEQVRPRAGPVKKILVFFGGVDVGNYTGRAIEALSEIIVADVHVDVVIGAQHPCLEQIKAACAQHGFICHVQTDKMAELMAVADLAIGAGGSASWERCCLGLPCIVGAVAQNQVQAAKDLSALGAVKYIGAVQEITVGKLKQEIEQAYHQDWLNKASSLGLGLVDAQGVMQVIKIMEKTWQRIAY
jgi:UDP-2,4-diacetamido-2,4,6-trideoxy-beta-L-altropyranose hydrolase